MAAIDDALFKYIGNDSGTSVYWDSGPSKAHGVLVGSTPHSPPLWVNDGGKNVIHFDAVAGYNGFTENAPRIQVIHDWGNFGGDDFSIAMWIRVKTDLAGTNTLLCNEYAAGSASVPGFAISHAGRRFQFRLRDASVADMLFGSDQIPLDEWCALVFTYDFSAKTPHMFFDAVETNYYSGQGPSDVASNLVDGDVSNRSTRWLESHARAIGSNAFNSSGYMSTQMLDSYFLGPCIWGRVLTADEIAELVALPTQSISSATKRVHSFGNGGLSS